MQQFNRIANKVIIVIFLLLVGFISRYFFRFNTCFLFHVNKLKTAKSQQCFFHLPLVLFFFRSVQKFFKWNKFCRLLFYFRFRTFHFFHTLLSALFRQLIQLTSPWEESRTCVFKMVKTEERKIVWQRRGMKEKSFYYSRQVFPFLTDCTTKNFFL